MSNHHDTFMKPYSFFNDEQIWSKFDTIQEYNQRANRHHRASDDIVRASRLLDNEIRILKIFEMNPEDVAEKDGANIDLDSQRNGKCVVLKTSTRQTEKAFLKQTKVFL
ncbi:26S proteasome regulatory subunit 6A-like protein [Forsythia ovata]|uniref:26S proteasome regulatory subunit 6A-like protein n=1 Tax=Forsythia ovata TaxID=205694 RepID=A0ABD1W6C7_9LAMI